MINSRQCGPIFVDRIYSRNNTSPFEFPWMALIAYNTETGLDFRCGGTIVSDKYILTAAHCISNLQTYTLAGVRVGEHNIVTDNDCDDLITDDCAPPVQDYTIAEVIPHPQYSPTKMENDIGLLRLSSSVNMSVGYASPELLKVELPVFPQDTCQRSYNRTEPPLKIVPQQLCGGTPGRNSCPGDSGGPLKQIGTVHNDARFVQYGIVSFGPKCCEVGSQPGVYTRVAYYMDWILDNMKP